MKKIIVYVLIVFGGTAAAFAQQQSPTPPRTPDPVQEVRRTMQQRQRNNEGFSSLKTLDGRTISVVPRAFALQNIVNIYRKPTKKELQTLAPSADDLDKYAPFLRQANTGLIKLIADKGCAENTTILNASEECLKFSMPGAGSSYSFRIESYRIQRLADLTYTDGVFSSFGVLAHALIVNVGDVPLDQISTETKGLRYLNEFQTVSDYKAAQEIDQQYSDGVEKDGFMYSRALYAVENATYILRSIAYRGNYYRAVQGYAYDELDFDKRKDVTIAFRIVNRDADGVIILWKKLSEKDAPKMKKPEKEDAETKENKFLAKETDN